MLEHRVTRHILRHGLPHSLYYPAYFSPDILSVKIDLLGLGVLILDARRSLCTLKHMDA